MSQRLFDELRLKGKSWPRLMDNPKLFAEAMRALKSQRQDWDAGTMEMFHLETMFSMDWVRSGEVVYDLSHSLAAMFSLTSAPEADWSHVPHEAFVIKCPREFLPMDGTIEPSHSYVYANRDRALAVADWDTTARVAVRYGGHIGADFETVVQDPKQLRERTQKRLDALNDPSVQIDVDLDKVPAWLKGAPPDVIREAARQLLVDEAIEALRDIERYKPRETVGLSVIVARLVANTVAYVLSQPPTSRGRSKNNGTMTFALSPPRDVVVDRAFRDAARAAVSAISEGSIVGVRRALAHHVRGHWRNQAVGTAHSERRLTWIKPHKRGSESLGSVVRRIEHLGKESNP